MGTGAGSLPCVPDALKHETETHTPVSQVGGTWEMPHDQRSCCSRSCAEGGWEAPPMDRLTDLGENLRSMIAASGGLVAIGVISARLRNPGSSGTAAMRNRMHDTLLTVLMWHMRPLVFLLVNIVYDNAVPLVIPESSFAYPVYTGLSGVLDVLLVLLFAIISAASFWAFLRNLKEPIGSPRPDKEGPRGDDPTASG